jgi:hypothetical protein
MFKHIGVADLLVHLAKSQLHCMFPHVLLSKIVLQTDSIENKFKGNSWQQNNHLTYTSNDRHNQVHGSVNFFFFGVIFFSFPFAGYLV